jgi:hypothetical protein
MIVITLLIAACLPACLARAEQLVLPAGTEMESEHDGQDEEVWIDEMHRSASTTLLASSRWLDDFFDDRSRFVDEENKSRARLKLTTTYYEDDEFEFKPRVNIRVHLPRLSERFLLLFFASEDEKPETVRSDATIPEDRNEKEASAALQYFLKETEKYNISFTGGVSFDYLYGGVRYRYEKDIGSWKGRFVTLLRYYTDDGWENLNTLDFDRELSEKWFLRATAQLDWFEEEDDLPLALILRLYQVLGTDKVLSYEWENHFASVEQGELTDLWLLVRYRQKFLRDWLFFEISPRVNFPKDNDREANFGLFFRIEMNFGFPWVKN